MELSKAGLINVYELWKRLGKVGHYSTVLRVLRLLRITNLVRVVSSKEEERNEKIYTITHFGELILALVKMDGDK